METVETGTKRDECLVCDGAKLTNSLVSTLSPLANVTLTHGMAFACWWGMGHEYFTTLDLYFTCTLSDKQQGHKTGDYKGSRGGEKQIQDGVTKGINPGPSYECVITLNQHCARFPAKQEDFLPAATAVEDL